jgi:hypothetical protein
MAPFSVSGKKLCRKSKNEVVFPNTFNIARLQINVAADS